MKSCDPLKFREVPKHLKIWSYAKQDWDPFVIFCNFKMYELYLVSGIRNPKSQSHDSYVIVYFIQYLIRMRLLWTSGMNENFFHNMYLPNTYNPICFIWFNFWWESFKKRKANSLEISTKSPDWKSGYMPWIVIIPCSLPTSYWGILPLFLQFLHSC